jgi:dihydroneopterin aldolase
VDKIVLKDIRLYGYHGVFPSEREKGQNFYIDVELFLDLGEAGKTDDLEKTVIIRKFMI